MSESNDTNSSLTASVKKEGKNPDLSTQVADALKRQNMATQNQQNQQNQQNINHGHQVPYNPIESDFKRSAVVLMSNILLALNPSDDNPIPSQKSVEFYRSGDKLPPPISGLFDSTMAYGVIYDSIEDTIQRQTAMLSSVAIQNYFAKNFDSIPRRKKFVNDTVNNVTIGYNIRKLFPMQEDEELDDYMKRLSTLKFTPAQASVQNDDDDDTPVKAKTVKKVSKEAPPKESIKEVKKEDAKPATKTLKKSAKKPVIQVESDTSEEADAVDLSDDADDSEIPVSDATSSADIDVSDESEKPKKKAGTKKRFGKH